MKSTLDQIEDIKRNGYSLDFATVFNHAFENYKKITIYSGLIILVFTIFAVMLYMGGIVIYFGAEALTKDYLTEFTTKKFTPIELLVQTLGISVLAAVIAPFTAGFLKMADCADKDIEFNVSTIFTYYKGEYFKQLFIAALIPTLIGTAIANLIKSYDIQYLGNVVTFMISYFMFLSMPLIVFGNLKGLDAIKSSIIIVTKNPINIFLFFIVGFLGSLVGLVGCCIGVIFTFVFNSSMMYATYYAIFGIEQEESIDSIGKYNID